MRISGRIALTGLMVAAMAGCANSTATPPTDSATPSAPATSSPADAGVAPPAPSAASSAEPTETVRNAAGKKHRLRVVFRGKTAEGAGKAFWVARPGEPYEYIDASRNFEVGFNSDYSFLTDLEGWLLYERGTQPVWWRATSTIDPGTGLVGTNLLVGSCNWSPGANTRAFRLVQQQPERLISARFTELPGTYIFDPQERYELEIDSSANPKSTANCNNNNWS